MSIQVAINGFGRIGRSVTRVLFENPDRLEIIAINDVSDGRALAHLLAFDSVYGRFPGKVTYEGDNLVVDGTRIPVLSEADPSRLPWAEIGAELVLECTGRLRDHDDAARHLQAGARKVLVSAPVKGADVTICLVVNEEIYSPSRHHVISNASCTTNCLAPVAKVIHDTFGIRRGFMTTCHAYTNDQRLLDTPHKDLRRARAAAVSIIPTSTGAARAIGEVIPDLKGRLDGMALRVPVPDGSVVDFVCELDRSADAMAVNAALREAASGPLNGIMAVTDEPIVSVDIVGDAHSAVVDAALTMSHGNLLKVVAWYDNEWAYATRLVELAERVGASLSAVPE